MSALPIEETKEIETETSALVAQAQSITIATADDYEAAADFLKSGVKALQRKIVDFFAPLKTKAHEAHRAICAAEAEQLAPITKAEGIVKQAMLGYQREQERIRIEEEKRRLAEARRLEEERRLQEAIELEAEGRQEEAEEVIAAPVLQPVVSIASAVPKVAGIATRETWKAEVTDALKLVRFIAEHPEFINLVTPNGTAINGLARVQKDALRIPGVRVYSESNLAAGRR